MTSEQSGANALHLVPLICDVLVLIPVRTDCVGCRVVSLDHCMVLRPRLFDSNEQSMSVLLAHLASECHIDDLAIVLDACVLPTRPCSMIDAVSPPRGVLRVVVCVDVNM